MFKVNAQWSKSGLTQIRHNGFKVKVPKTGPILLKNKIVHTQCPYTMFKWDMIVYIV